jgi:hypothetical protein
VLASFICIVAAQSSAINLETRAARLPVFLAELSKQVGEPLECAPNLAGQVVLVRFKGVGKEEALSRIAGAVDGEWQVVKGVTFLSRSTSLQRELERKWRSQAIARFADAIKPLTDQIDTNPRFDGEAAKKLVAEMHALDKQIKGDESYFFREMQRVNAIHARGPGGRAISRIFRSMGAAEIADLPVGRTVFSLNPTRLQRPMPKGIADVVQTLRKEQEIWNQELEANPPVTGDGGYMSTDPRFAKFSFEPVRQVLMVASRHNPRSNIMFELSGFDSHGSLLFYVTSNLMPTNLLPDTEKLGKLRSAKGDFELSPTSRRLLELMDYSYAKPDRVDPQLAAIVRDPVKNEPLQFAHSEIVLAYAEKAGKNLVASINDQLSVTDRDPTRSGKVNLDAFIGSAILLSNIDLEVDERWISIKPSTRFGTPRMPDDRFACRKLLESALENGYFTLDALADFAKVVDPSWNALAFQMARVLLPRSERILQEVDWQPLKVYAELGVAQRRSLLNEGAISTMALSNQAKKEILDACTTTGFGSYESGIFLAGRRLNRPPSRFQEEPTIFLADGIPPGELRAKTAAKDELLVGTRSGKYVAWTRFATPESLRSQMQEEREVFSTADDYWLGKSVTLDLNLGLQPGVELRMKMVERQFDLRKPPTSLKDLPADIQRRIGG